ncbi:hypothetical protein KFE98_11455 [bacterium SCSIO 12741]|nr:hypothetical protein KFE98_11455 [bacterium SCSIO 12741]
MMLKLLGGLAFALTYKFYYKYGDTFGYYEGIIILSQIFQENTGAWWRIMINFTNSFDPETFVYMLRFDRLRFTDTFTVIKIGTIFNILSFNNFFLLTLWFSLFSFLGTWKLYLVFVDQFENIKNSRILAISALFIPSVLFWGSGIMKDSLILGMLGHFVYHMAHILKAPLSSFLHLVLALFFAFLIFLIKPYVIICLAPAMLLWFFLNARKSIKHPIIRVFLGPTFILFGFGASVAAITGVSQYSSRYDIDNILSTAQVYQNYHSASYEVKDGRRSSYDLGQYDKSFTGVVLMMPASINVTLFRPYLWEVNSVAMLPAAIESGIFFFLLLRMFYITSYKRLLRELVSNNFLTLSLTFSLVFAFAVGFSSYNFGALVRYKIPCLPFFLATVLYLSRVASKKVIQEEVYRRRSRYFSSNAVVEK